MRGKTRTAARTTGTVLIIAAIVLVGVLAVPGAVGAEESYIVLSGSMEPDLQPGDIVVVQSTPAEEIEVGDVITYREDGDLGGPGVDRVTHRVVDRQQTAEGVVFRTKGDANEAVDSEPVTDSQIIGSVWFHLPYIGRAILFAQSRLGNILLIVVPGILLVGSGLRTLYTAATQETTNND